MGVMEPTPLERALAAVDGNQSELARICGVTQPTVWGWLNSKRKRLPAEYVRLVSTATGLPSHELRPDIFPVPQGSKRAGRGDRDGGGVRHAHKHDGAEQAPSTRDSVTDCPGCPASPKTAQGSKSNSQAPAAAPVAVAPPARRASLSSPPKGEARRASG